MMYRTHCQRILDTVIRANFDEARHLLFDTILNLKFCFGTLLNVMDWTSTEYLGAPGTSRSRASCCTSGRACHPTCSLSSAPRRWWTLSAFVTPSSTRPSPGYWCPPSCKHCRIGDYLVQMMQFCAIFLSAVSKIGQNCLFFLISIF